jgi:hypothetical protein
MTTMGSDPEGLPSGFSSSLVFCRDQLSKIAIAAAYCSV